MADVADDPVDVHVARPAPRARSPSAPSGVSVIASPSSQMSTWSAATPTSRASCAWCTRWRYSPCTGTNHSGVKQVEQELQLLLRRVARHVHRRRAVVHDLGAGAVQRVDDARHVRLVARDRVRADHDDVVGRDLHVLVLVRGHQRQRAHRLALRTGADDAHLVGRVAWASRRCRSPRGRECR